MAMHKPGAGRGPVVHLFRSRALEILDDEAGVLTYDHYTGSPRGRYVIASRGHRYEMDPQEVNSYVIGVDDGYLRTRAEIIKIMDELGEATGDDTMRLIQILDERLGRPIHTAAEPFLASRAERGTAAPPLAHAS